MDTASSALTLVRFELTIRDIVIRAVLSLGSIFGLVLADLTPASAQVEDVPYEDEGLLLPEIEGLFPEVFPGLTHVDPRSGTPPVWRAYTHDASTGEEKFSGLIFLTSDVPPEEKGYTAPIDVLVGMDVQGRITGARIIRYVESLRSSRGDFLRGFYEEQFTGKRITDRFMVRRDIETVSGATISAAAAARGIRNAARRVFSAYLLQQDAELTREEIDSLSWPELELRGFTDRLIGLDDGALDILLSLAPIADSAMGELFLGDSYDRALSRLGRDRVSDKKQWLVGVDGRRMVLFRGPQLYVVRGQDTLRFEASDLALVGDPSTGKVAGQFRNAGVLLSDSSLTEDDTFTWEIKLGVGMPVHTVQHVGDHEPQTIEATPIAATVADTTSPVPSGPTPGDGPLGRGPPDSAGSDRVVASPAPAGGTSQPAQLPDLEVSPSVVGTIFDLEEESQTVLARTLETTSWPLAGLVAGMLALTSTAFVTKIVWIRWVTLTFTLALLGFWAGDFLSVSHISAVITVGPGVFLEDIPLLLLVSFTAITTLLWGRVFCGYLCPFGALQDFLEYLVPRKMRRELPQPVHENGLYLKYGVLGVVLLPAIAGTDISVFQYFEPFGTVFFWSRSTVLWLIAGALLMASAIIPRFYCRYVCPLGAFLALASTVSPFRITRVPHCRLCVVCQNNCPTGAIRRERVNFRECVRCNICEGKLRQAAGVCGHDLDEVSRLIQIKRGGKLVPLLEPPRTE